MQWAFFDVKVFNPFAKTHIHQNLESVFRNCERDKKRLYNERIISIEHGSFTPVILSAFGELGYESGIFLSKLIEKLSVKRGVERSVVTKFVRTKLLFELVRSQVACIRVARRCRR